MTPKSESDDKADYIEGPDAAHRFERTLNRALAISKTELDRKIARI